MAFDDFEARDLEVPEQITCIDCGGPCYLMSATPEDGWHDGDLAVYRCRDCHDRWDTLVGDADDL